jgi:hypothetical protein
VAGVATVTDPRVTVRRVKRIITGALMAIDTIRETLIASAKECDAMLDESASSKSTSGFRAVGPILEEGKTK